MRVVPAIPVGATCVKEHPIGPLMVAEGDTVVVNGFEVAVRESGRVASAMEWHHPHWGTGFSLVLEDV